MSKLLNFIVVDDDPSNNLLCRFIIRQFFKESDVQLFTEPEKALAVIAGDDESYRHKKTVLFLDINMPTMTGWQFLDKFKTLASKIRKQFIIYILSSSVDGRDKEKADANPLVSGFISKPLDPKRIKQIFSTYAI